MKNHEHTKKRKRSDKRERLFLLPDAKNRNVFSWEA